MNVLNRYGTPEHPFTLWLSLFICIECTYSLQNSACYSGIHILNPYELLETTAHSKGLIWYMNSASYITSTFSLVNMYAKLEHQQLL